MNHRRVQPQFTLGNGEALNPILDELERLGIRSEERAEGWRSGH